MDRAIKIDPGTAGKILELIQGCAGFDCHMIVISFPDLGEEESGGMLGPPSFCSSLAPPVMEAMIGAIGNLIASGTHVEPVIHRFDN
jgi:hypothetical protein